MGIINPFANKREPEARTTLHDGPKIRLLACTQCKTIEPLDWYEGLPENDVVLQVATEKHKDGVERRPHVGQLFDVAESAWNNPEAQAMIRQQVAAKLDPNAETGLGSEAYTLMDTFREDAMACWEQHGRTVSCGDYKSDAKQLIPNTQEDRRDAGMGKFDRHNPATKRYLCEYCPVHSLVQQAMRKKAGLYDK